MFTPLALAILLAQQPVAEMRAAGTFDVAAAPDAAPGGPANLLTLAKTYRGALDGSGSVQMVGSGDPAGGTAAYAGVETVTATLAGRHGGFTLIHAGWMHAGTQELTVRIAPGSGTGGLAGISGTMEIVIAGGVHRYVLHYRLVR